MRERMLIPNQIIFSYTQKIFFNIKLMHSGVVFIF